MGVPTLSETGAFITTVGFPIAVSVFMFMGIGWLAWRLVKSHEAFLKSTQATQAELAASNRENVMTQKRQTKLMTRLVHDSTRMAELQGQVIELHRQTADRIETLANELAENNRMMRKHFEGK